MPFRFYCMLLILCVSACAPATELPPLPTLASFPTESPESIAQIPAVTNTRIIPSATATDLPTDESAATGTNTPLPILTSTQIATMTPTLRPIIPTDSPDSTDFPQHETAQYADISYQEAVDLLYATELMTIPMGHVRQIYQRGQLRGLQSDFLLSVGDCNSESHFYLESLLDNDLSDENYQSTISEYSRAFAFKGQSVNSGLNALSVMDPFWASSDVCPAGESPLTCDYRSTQAFAAMIMFGANDINVLNTAGYEMAMREIIETTLDRDIIPILSTFSVRPLDDDRYAQGVRFNGVLIHLAQEYDIPLVNFWLATRDIAGNGILHDNAHLTVEGFDIRNQLTITILEQIRTDIILQES